jgi:hypothetical protein
MGEEWQAILYYFYFSLLFWWDWGLNSQFMLYWCTAGVLESQMFQGYHPGIQTARFLPSSLYFISRFMSVVRISASSINRTLRVVVFLFLVLLTVLGEGFLSLLPV